MYQQIKDKHSVIIWCAARCFSSFQRSIAPMENTPNKVSQRRARARAERRISRSTFTRSLAKRFSCSFIFPGTVPSRRINECQLFLCSTIRKFTFGPGLIRFKWFAGAS
ncbi:hypothetical protein CgunFtcFv8_017288 [Champsocephalus gunnari]|uniref:Uncharacterized protein n=1 Tax=Champsocephalus gunnari TaxID=52237 RepID=A0AAN8HR06_CHAGU|nr:hypothetical protein CgunFtcFv8_017288 [Champsocephalus gunnari]